MIIKSKSPPHEFTSISFPRCGDFIPGSGERLDCEFAPWSNVNKFKAILSHLPENTMALRNLINDIVIRKSWTLQISEDVAELSNSMKPLTFLQMIEKCVRVVNQMIGKKHIPPRDCLPPANECWNFLSLVGGLQDECDFESTIIDWFCEQPRPAGFELIKYMIVLLTYPGLISEVISRFQLFNCMKSSISNDVDKSHYELYDSFASRDVKLTDHAFNWFRWFALDCLKDVLTMDVIKVIKQSLIKSSEEDRPCIYCSEFHPVKYCHHVHNYKCKKCKKFMVMNNKSDLSRNLFLDMDPDIYYKDVKIDLMCNDCNICCLCGDFVPFVDVFDNVRTRCPSCWKL
jgi:hypothetical protein